MTRGLADSSVFIANETGRSLDTRALPDELAVSIITIGELRTGVLAARSVEVRDQGLRMPVNDAWIAATALALDVPINTQDDDFPELSDLEVIKVWCRGPGTLLVRHRLRQRHQLRLRRSEPATTESPIAHITTSPHQMGGVPSIRDLRFPVATVVAVVADGMSTDEDPRRAP